MADERRRLADAVTNSGGRINGADLRSADSRIAECAASLRVAGVGDDDLVVLGGLASDAVLVAAVACWSLGAAAWVSPRTLHPAQAGHASFLVTADLAVQRCARAASRVHESVAVIHETSGSTGEPKLAQRSVDSIDAEQVGYHRGLRLNSNDAVRIPVPVAHSFGWGVAVSALLTGCDVDVRSFATPASVAAGLDRGQATTVALTPALLRLLIGTGRRGERQPRAILVGAGQVSDELEAECRKRFGTAITRGYGSSETGGIFIGPTGMGRPISSVQIVSPEVGSRGELVVRTRTPVLGYLDDPVRASRSWNTRDIVERNAAGQAWFVERVPGAVRANGKPVDVGPTKAALGAIAGVEDVTFVVLPRPGQPDLEDVVAVVAGRQVNRETVERAISATAHRGLVPRVRVYAELPRTDIGKLDRKVLTEWIRRDGGHGRA